MEMEISLIGPLINDTNRVSLSTERDIIKRRHGIQIILI